MGSTAVPGLAAKPIIDVAVIVEEPEVSAAREVLEDLGFTRLGELGIPRRWAFNARPALRNKHLRRGRRQSRATHLAVRHCLRQDPPLRARYVAVKMRLVSSGLDIDR